MSNSDSIGDTPAVVLVPLDLIDPSPAAAVRAGQREETVADYALVLIGDDHTPPAELPAIDCWQYTTAAGGEGYALGDGAHRLAAYQRAGRVVVPCSVRRCGCQQEAERLAWRHAAGANAAHGLPRSREDKRAAVKAVIVRPEYEDAPDTELATVCNVSPTLVALVRRELSAAKVIPAASNAHASNPKRRYKENARLRPGYETDAAGKLVKVPTQNRAVPPATPAETAAQNHVVLDGKADASATNDRGPTRGGGPSPPPRVGQPCPTPDPEPAGDDLPVGPDPVPIVVQPPAPAPASEPVLDRFRRPVPAHLVAVFRDRKAEVLAVVRAVKAAVRGLDAIDLPEFQAGRGQDGYVGGELSKLTRAILSSLPFAVCPGCDATGRLPGRACYHCVHLRDGTPLGWVTRHGFHTLPRDLKERAKAFAGAEAVDEFDAEEEARAA